MNSVSLRILVAALCLALNAPLLAASSDADRVQMGHRITIGPEETVNDVTCIGCSVRVLGKVNGDISAIAGSVTVEGKVGHDIAVVAGNVRLATGAEVGGDVAVVGGRILRQPDTVVRGETTALSIMWLILPLAFVIALLVALVAVIIAMLQRNRTAPSTPTTASGSAAR